MSLFDRLKKFFRPQKSNCFEIEDSYYLPKVKKDYQLEQLLKTAEQIPLYYESKDIPTDIGDNFTKRDKVLFEIEQTHEKALESIDRIFGPVLEKMYEDFLNEKRAYVAHQIRNEIEKAEKINNELRERAGLWKKAVYTVVCTETATFNINRLYGERCAALGKLEETYAPYNDGKGLIALGEIRQRLGWQERESLHARGAERTVGGKDMGPKSSFRMSERLER